jgi:hypothetical protein
MVNRIIIKIFLKKKLTLEIKEIKDVYGSRLVSRLYGVKLSFLKISVC